MRLGIMLFLMSNFYSLSQGGASEGRMCLSFSTDGKNWGNIGGSFVYGTSGVTTLRDPHIIKFGGYWWGVYTKGTGTEITAFCLIKSQDLLNWTFIQDVSVGNPSGCWGPKWFIDPNSPDFPYVIFEINPNTGAHQIMRPTNAAFTQWTTPITLKQTGSLSINGFDGQMFYANGTYYFIHCVAGGKFYLYKCSIREGQYSLIRSDFIPGINEACWVIQLPDKTWRIYFHRLDAYKFSYVDIASSNIETGAIGTVTDCTGPSVWIDGFSTFVTTYLNGSVEVITDQARIEDIVNVVLTKGLASIPQVSELARVVGPNTFSRSQTISINDVVAVDALKLELINGQGGVGLGIYDEIANREFYLAYYGSYFSVDFRNNKLIAHTYNNLWFANASELFFKVNATSGDIEYEKQTAGLVLKSPNGTKYRLKVDNSGVISTQAI